MSEPTNTENKPQTGAPESLPNPFDDTSAAPKSASPVSEPPVPIMTHVSGEIASSPIAQPDAATTTVPALEATPATPVSPPSTTPVAQSAPQAEQPIDPRIAGLVAIFPTFDHDLLRDVLNQCNNNEDQAVDVLLGLSDPDHVPATNVATHTSQTDLDAELAQRLLLEEQDAAAREYFHSVQGRGSDNRQQPPVPYVTRQNPRRRSGELPPDASLQEQFRDFISPRRDKPHSPGSSGAGAGGLTANDFQESFNKMADTGKKTFNSIFTKVKAKLASLDGGAGPSQPQQGYEYSDEHSGQHESGAPPAPQPQTWTSSTGAGVAPSAPVRRQTGSSGYDLSGGIPPPQPINYPQPAASASPSLSVPTPAERPTSPPAAIGVDRSKLGLMPKRPVSLISPRTSMDHNPSADTPQADSWDDEDDDLYATPTPTKPPAKKLE